MNDKSIYDLFFVHVVLETLSYTILHLIQKYIKNQHLDNWLKSLNWW